MRLDALGQAQAVRQLLLDHHLRVGAEHDVRLVPGHPQAVEQALGINHPTGSGYGNKDSHFDAKHPPIKARQICGRPSRLVEPTRRAPLDSRASG
uniref:Uncharacterized protein n=1 Tax=uncultured bacterium HF770_11D24 TaxID=710817 RepID=E0XPV1_9BACT|nr:hypothetical protein [uncultured bacterium HF770_11D24]